MAGKKIIWSLRAKKELKITLEYFNKRNGSVIYSLKIIAEIEDLTKTLSKSEFIGRLTSNKITRVIPMKRASQILIHKRKFNSEQHLYQ